MKAAKKFVIPAILIVAGVCFLWPHLDRTASKVVLSVSGFGLLLAWYSILSLQEQRKERFWPHTTDRLINATFRSLTLVFVVNLVIPKPLAIQTPPTVQFRVERFVDELNDLIRDHKWAEPAVKDVVAAHFQKLTGNGRLELRLPDEHGFMLVPDKGVLTVTQFH
jgi:hypothetical protein